MELTWTGEKVVFTKGGERLSEQVTIQAKDADDLRAQATVLMRPAYPNVPAVEFDERVRLRSATIENGTMIGGGMTATIMYIPPEGDDAVFVQVSHGVWSQVEAIWATMSG